MQLKSNAVAMLGGVMEPLGRCLTRESAREILAVRADAVAIRRIEKLARDCDAGRLTPAARAEYQLLADVGELVALLQAKARRYLAEIRTPKPSGVARASRGNGPRRKLCTPAAGARTFCPPEPRGRPHLELASYGFASEFTRDGRRRAGGHECPRSCPAE